MQVCIWHSPVSSILYLFLCCPSKPGLAAVRGLTAEGRRLAQSLPPAQRAELERRCGHLDELGARLATMTEAGQGGSEAARVLASEIEDELKVI